MHHFHCFLILIITYLSSDVYGFPLEECEQKDQSLICNCNSRQNITIIFKSLAKLRFVNILEINHCGFVTIKASSFRAMTLKKLILNDLIELTIGSSAFLAVNSVEFISISNIGSFKASTHCIRSKNTTHLEFSNVTADHFPDNSLIGSEISTVFFQNCHFNILKSNAFNFSNVENFTFLNSKVDSLEINSVRLNKTTSNISFKNCSFGDTDTRSIFVESAASLEIDSCSFESTHSGFLAGTVDIMKFNRNDVKIAKPGSFSDLNVSSEYIVNMNHFTVAERGFLEFPHDSKANITVEYNSFRCDCELAWMWDVQYDRLRSSGICENSDKNGFRLRDFEISFSEGGDCNELVTNKTTIQVLVTEPEEAGEVASHIQPTTASSSTNTYFDIRFGVLSLLTIFCVTLF